jgi:hypothetical protein
MEPRPREEAAQVVGSAAVAAEQAVVAELPEVAGPRRRRREARALVELALVEADAVGGVLGPQGVEQRHAARRHDVAAGHRPARACSRSARRSAAFSMPAE